MRQRGGVGHAEADGVDLDLLVLGIGADGVLILVGLDDLRRIGHAQRAVGLQVFGVRAVRHQDDRLPRLLVLRIKRRAFGEGRGRRDRVHAPDQTSRDVGLRLVAADIDHQAIDRGRDDGLVGRQRHDRVQALLRRVQRPLVGLGRVRQSQTAVGLDLVEDATVPLVVVCISA